MVKDEITDSDLIWAEQAEQLGTGHAVQMALPHLPKDGKSLILYGDVPLTRLDTLQNLIEQNTHGISMLTMSVENPFGLGRIVRQDDKVIAIVEQKTPPMPKDKLKKLIAVFIVWIMLYYINICQSSIITTPKANII